MINNKYSKKNVSTHISKTNLYSRKQYVISIQDYILTQLRSRL